MERRRFTREFKLEAVRLIRDRGVSYAQASQDLKVHPTQLRNWVKAFAVRIVRQKVEALAPHLAAVAKSSGAPQIPGNPRVAARQIAHPANLAIVPAHLHATATAACRFFDRRLSLITRAFGSPKMPRTVGSGRKPGKNMHPKVAAFASLFPPFIRHAKTDPLRNAKTLRNSQVFLPSPTQIYPLNSTKTLEKRSDTTTRA